MADWTPTPEQAQAAKVIAAGGFGSFILVYLRHPGTIFRAFCMVAIGIGLALVFTEDVAALLGMQIIPTAVIIGLLGKAMAESALKFVEAGKLADYISRKVP